MKCLFLVCFFSFICQISSHQIKCSTHEFNMAIVHLKTCSIQEPRAIQEKLLQGASFCSEVNQLIVRCVTPLKSCFDSAGVSEVANALLHDVVPLDKPMLFKNINQGKNCSEIAKQYAAKSGQPILQSTVCNHVESWENRHNYEKCKERANVNMKLKLAQFRGQRETLMKSVCATVDQLVDCGRRLHHCLTTSEVELINAGMLDNLEKLLGNLESKTGYEASYCKAFNIRRRPSMDINENQPTRLASPSINVLDYSNRRHGNGRGRGTASSVSYSILTLCISVMVSSINKLNFF